MESNEAKGVIRVPNFIHVKTRNFLIEKYTLKKPMADMHFHDAYELYFILSGTRDYFIEEQFFKLGEGDLAVVPSGALHRTAGKGATRFLIYFSPEFLERYYTKPIRDLLTAPLKTAVYHPSQEQRTRIMELMTTLLQEYELNKKEKSAPREAAIALLLSDLLRLIAKLPNAAAQKENPAPRSAQIVKYINENYNEIFSVEDVANHFFMSKYYFCRLFRKTMGIPLFTYINTIKIQQSCLIMEKENCTLTEIATRCGFNTSSYFCKVFKNIMGVSPGEYRKQKKLSK